MESRSKHRPHRPKAATAEVLGHSRREPPRNSKWKKQYQRLTELRDHLLRRQVDLAKDAIQEQPSFSVHMADAGTDTYDRDFALGMLSAEQDAVYQIEQALDRIRHGTYGICELTGKPISPERLEAIPWTRFSAAAERTLEQNGEVKHATLGPRETVTKETPGTRSDDT